MSLSPSQIAALLLFSRELPDIINTLLKATGAEPITDEDMRAKPLREVFESRGLPWPEGMPE